MQKGLAMDEVPGSVGTSASFSLRLGQAIFSSASLLFMSLGVEFYSYTAFCYLVTVMGLVIPWSFTLALVDGYSVLVKCPLRQPGILLIIVVGDWVSRLSSKHHSDTCTPFADCRLTHNHQLFVTDSTFFSTGIIRSHSSCSLLND
ncbi:unnamed protein product [Malus baccata var. baccata]